MVQKEEEEIKWIHNFKENLILKADLSPLVSCSYQVSNNQDDCMEILQIHFPNYDEIPADGQWCNLHKLPMTSLAFMSLRCALCVNYRSVMSCLIYAWSKCRVQSPGSTGEYLLFKKI